MMFNSKLRSKILYLFLALAILQVTVNAAPAPTGKKTTKTSASTSTSTSTSSKPTGTTTGTTTTSSSVGPTGTTNSTSTGTRTGTGTTTSTGNSTAPTGGPGNSTTGGGQNGTITDSFKFKPLNACPLPGGKANGTGSSTNSTGKPKRNIVTLSARAGEEFLGFRGVEKALADEYASGQYPEHLDRTAELGVAIYVAEDFDNSYNSKDKVCLIYAKSLEDWKALEKIWFTQDKINGKSVISDFRNDKVRSKLEDNRKEAAEGAGLTIGAKKESSYPMIRFSAYNNGAQMAIPNHMIKDHIIIKCYDKNAPEVKAEKGLKYVEKAAEWDIKFTNC